MQTDPNCPSARLSRLGPEVLTDEELLSLILRKPLPQVSELIVKYGSVPTLLNADRSQLALSVGSDKASAIVSAHLTYGPNWPGYRTDNDSGNRYRWSEVSSAWIFSCGGEK